MIKTWRTPVRTVFCKGLQNTFKIRIRRFHHKITKIIFRFLFSFFFTSGGCFPSFLTSDSDSACRNPPRAHLQTAGAVILECTVADERTSEASAAREANRYSKLVSNCPGSFLIVPAVVFVVLVVVWVVLGVVLELVEVVASHYCYRCWKKHPQDHPNHYQDHENHSRDN